jgi:uncharacterized protein
MAVSVSMNRIKERFQVKEKLMKIKANPTRVSSGYALGVFLGTTPFIGFKVFIALILTTVFKWNKTSSVIGVYHINILTAPLFYGFAFVVGRWVLGSDVNFVFPDTMSFSAFYEAFLGNAMIFYSLLIGGIVLGVPMAGIAYWLSFRLLSPRHGSNRQAHLFQNPDAVLPKNPLSEGYKVGIWEDKNGQYSLLPKKEYEPNDRYTLITGASSGLGKEMAIECASQGQNVILVALPGRNLDVLSGELEKEFGIRAAWYEVDLTHKEEIHAMVKDVLSRYKVNFLINNAGTGGTIPFEESSVEYLERIIQLNITAVSLLTRLLIPELKKYNKAWILNVSSMAAFSPFPYKTIYPASKAFVANFSRSLGEELKETNVKVAVLHPGPILTNPDVAIRIIKQGSKGKRGLYPARELARLSIQGVKQGKQVMVPGMANKFNKMLMTYMPSEIVLPFLSRVIVREIKAEAA